MKTKLKKDGKTLLAVTSTELYLIDGQLGQPVESLAKEWFVKYRGSSHAWRDGSKIGGSKVVHEVKVLTEDGRTIDLKSGPKVINHLR